MSKQALDVEFSGASFGMGYFSFLFSVFALIKCSVIIYYYPGVGFGFRGKIVFELTMFSLTKSIVMCRRSETVVVRQA